MSEIEYQRVQRDLILPLRQIVLRPGKTLAEACFDGDDNAVHYAALSGTEACACLTMMRLPMPDTDDPDAWQLRGMACAESQRGKGLGRKLLAFMEHDLNPNFIWCNAREIAVPFYQRCGWTICSDAFDIADVGTHFRMFKDLSKNK